MRPPLLLLRNCDLYDPASVGVVDVLIAGDRIAEVTSRGVADVDSRWCEVVDLEGRRVIPGLVDGHAHVTGGGGEAGYASKVPPRAISEFTSAGVTSVVGLLGTDGRTRTMRELVAKTYALRELGMSAWCWTGSYEMPVQTLTGSVRDDMVFIEPVLGVGELAISDHRSSQPSLDEVLRVASDVHVGGLITGKAGVLHLHLGDGTRGLDMVRRALAESEIPPRVFHPTHVNRRLELMEEAWALLEGTAGARGLHVDLTAFPEGDVGDGRSASDALVELIDRRGHALGATVSSDGGGCLPCFDARGEVTGYGVGCPRTLLDTLRACVQGRGLSLEQVLPTMTSQVAGLLRLHRKGRVAAGADADLVVLDTELSPTDVLALGQWMVREGHTRIRGPFEDDSAREAPP